MPGEGASFDRFAGWRPGPARAALLVLAALLLLAALVPLGAGAPGPRAGPASPGAAAPGPADADLDFYAGLGQRLRGGGDYYDIVVAAQRRAGYPVTPALAVRLPTMAYIQAWLGAAGQRVLAIILLLAVMGAWYARLRAEPGTRGRVALGVALVPFGSFLALNRDYYPLHELWAGLLIALAFALHRPGRHWIAAVTVAALALAVRELALPFVGLMAAWAIAGGRHREAAGWGAVLVLFALAMWAHFAAVAPHVLPSDAPSPSWLAGRGLGGALGNVVLSSPLYLLPHWLAGPLVVLALLGWLGWKSPAGLFGVQLYAGYLLAFAIAGRADNFYWGVLITPAFFIGLAFAARALASLWQAAGRQDPAAARLDHGGANAQ